MLKKTKMLLNVILLFSSTYLSSQYKYDLAVCAIFQNEARFLKEWIEFYKLIGVQHFYLYNHFSTDNYLEILEPYIERNEIELYHWTNPNHQKSQMETYNDALNRAKNNVKWLAFLDLDEFLFPVEKYNLVDFLKEYEFFGGVCANWVMYGTSYIEKIPYNNLLIESLNRCNLSGKINTIVKTIVRPETVERMASFHFANYKDGYFNVLADKTRFSGMASPHISIDKLRINHYWTRDKYYLNTIKIPRAEALYKEGFRRGFEYWYIDPEIAKQMTPTEFCLAVDEHMNKDIDTSIYKYVSELRGLVYANNQ